MRFRGALTLTLAFAFATSAGASQVTDESRPAAPNQAAAQTPPSAAPAAPSPTRILAPPRSETERRAGPNIDIHIRVSDNQGLAREVKMVVTNDHRGSVRQGADVPIVNGEKQVQYKAVGLNVDARPWVLDDGRIRVSIVLEGNMVGKADPERPVFYSIRQSLDLALRDGQTIEASRSSDPGGDRAFTISVTAKIVR